MRFGREWAFEKSLIQGDFFEQGDRQDLEKSVERDLQGEALLDDGDQHVHRHGDPDLRLHRVLGRSEKRLDAQVLLDPLEEQLHPPAVAVQVRHGEGGHGEVVGQEVERPTRFRVPVLHPPQGLGILVPCLRAHQHDGLVAEQARGLVDGLRVPATELGVGLGAGHEERARRVDGVQPREVQVGPVHDVEGARPRDQQVQDLHIALPGVRDVDERGDAAAQVQQRVQLDAGLRGSEQRPGEDGHAQVDGGRVQRVHGVVALQPQVLSGVQGAGPRDQPLRELGVDAPVPALVGVREGGAPHRRADAHVVQLGRLRRQAGLDVAQALPAGQLRERRQPGTAPRRTASAPRGSPRSAPQGGGRSSTAESP